MVDLCGDISWVSVLYIYIDNNYMIYSELLGFHHWQNWYRLKLAKFLRPPQVSKALKGPSEASRDKFLHITVMKNISNEPITSAHQLLITYILH